MPGKKPFVYLGYRIPPMISHLGAGYTALCSPFLDCFNRTRKLLGYLRRCEVFRFLVSSFLCLHNFSSFHLMIFPNNCMAPVWFSALKSFRRFRPLFWLGSGSLPILYGKSEHFGAVQRDISPNCPPIHSTHCCRIALRMFCLVVMMFSFFDRCRIARVHAHIDFVT